MINYKKILCIICVLVCLMSTLVLPSFAYATVPDSGPIHLKPTVTNVPEDSVRYWFCISNNSTVKEEVKDFSISSITDNSFLVDLSNYDFTLFENLAVNPEFNWMALQLYVDVSNQILPDDLLDYDAIRFDIQWNIDVTNQVADMDIFNGYLSNLNYNLGFTVLTSTSFKKDYVGFPRLGSYGGVELNGLYGLNFVANSFDGKVYKNRYEFDSSHWDDFVTEPFIISLPYGLFCGNKCSLTLDITLVDYEERPEDTTAPDTPDVPDVPDSGITDKDLENAYNKGYTEGLNKGQDKNYVYGFVNGTWSAVLDTYDILAKGISIGGITLGNIITSIIIITVLAIILKKVI